MTLDHRLTLAKPGLASSALEGLVRSERFVDPVPMRVISPRAAIRGAPGLQAEQVDQALFGEVFHALEVENGFVWGQAARDGYVGWVEAESLASDTPEPTHRVIALRTFAFAEPSIKSPSRGPFSLNALVTLLDSDGHLARAEAAGWISARHLAPIGAAFEDATTVAERFLGTPYLWGGRDSVGIDCSGLIQQALYASGQACPRDTDLQTNLGRDVPPGGVTRGDLVFWRGHVGMMLDDQRLLHANAHHMAVAIEPLDEARRRIAGAGGGQPTAFRRI